MEDLADIVNIAIKELTRHSFELPGFTSLTKEAQRGRAQVNRALYRQVYDALTAEGRNAIDTLLAESASESHQTRWNMLKQDAGSPTLTHLRELLERQQWLVRETYIAPFSHFIPCGVWEAVYILDGLLKNKSDIQPDVLHADTQGQSEPVFALAHLLGIELMPRIRNWKNIDLCRADRKSRYEHIDSLFKETIHWTLIETHFPDMLRVALSIKAGRISASTILRRLGTYSRKNRLYQAFCEPGRVVRSGFLLRYISDKELRSAR